MRTRFNRPVLMALLIFIALFFALYVHFDGFQHRIEEFGEPGDFKSGHEDSQRAFDNAVSVWFQKSGYEKSELNWRQITGKPAYSEGLGVREDLVIYVRKTSRRSYQAWGIGNPTTNFRLVQVYRGMYVSEWSKEKAEETKAIFDKEAQAMANLCGILRPF